MEQSGALANTVNKVFTFKDDENTREILSVTIPEVCLNTYYYIIDFLFFVFYPRSVRLYFTDIITFIIIIITARSFTRGLFEYHALIIISNPPYPYKPPEVSLEVSWMFLVS